MGQLLGFWDLLSPSFTVPASRRVAVPSKKWDAPRLIWLSSGFRLVVQIGETERRVRSDPSRPNELQKHRTNNPTKKFFLRSFHSEIPRFSFAYRGERPAIRAATPNERTRKSVSVDLHSIAQHVRKMSADYADICPCHPNVTYSVALAQKTPVSCDLRSRVTVRKPQKTGSARFRF